MELFTARGQADLYPGFNWSINYTTADVINLSKRKASYTKTINLPYTKNNANIFQGLDQDNSDNIGYDTRKVIQCYLQHNGRVLIQGIGIVLSWDILKERQTIQLQIIQRTKTLISDLKGISLKALDFSKLNHNYNINEIEASYLGINRVNGVYQSYEGYSYPLIDYGKDDTIPFQWDVLDLRPSLYLREIIDVIFLTAGKTYTSDFFNSPYFRQLILINTLDKIKYTDAQRLPFNTDVDNSNEWYLKGPSSVGPLPGPPYNNVPWWNTTFQFSRNVPIDNVITDVNAQWDLSDTNNPVCNIQRTGRYNFVFSMQFFMETYINYPEYFNNYWYIFTLPHTEVQGEITNSIEIVKNGTVYSFEDFFYTPVNSTWDTGYTDPENWIAYPNPPQFINWEIELDLLDGDEIYFRVTNLPFDESGLAEWLCSRNVTNYVEITSELVEAEVLPGDEISFNNYIPNIKASSFIDTIFNTFNLWAIDDPYNPDNIIIEPRTNFFNRGGYVDWSGKQDVSRKKTFNFLADKLPQRYIYEMAKAEDVEIKNFFDLNEVGYGDYDSEVPSDINTNEIKIKTSISPIKATEQNGLIYPLLYKQEDENSEKRGLGNLFKIAFLSEQAGYWQLRQGGQLNGNNRYLCASEFDDPKKPIHALTFGTPATNLLQSQGAYWNLYRLFHKLTEEEKTRKGAKIVSMYIYLDENDINQLDIRRVVYVSGVYFRIVQISNFNPLTTAPTLVKLLQIEHVNYDFTSNEIIYKTMGASDPLLATNKNEPIITNTNKNVSTS